MTGDAERDLEDIEAYVESYGGADFADEVSDMFEEAFERLCDAPFSHSVYQFPDGYEPRRAYRGFNVYRYKVFYRVDEEAGVGLIHRIRRAVSAFTRAGIEGDTLEHLRHVFQLLHPGVPGKAGYARFTRVEIVHIPEKMAAVDAKPVKAGRRVRPMACRRVRPMAGGRGRLMAGRRAVGLRLASEAARPPRPYRATP